jgi:hypothetical protein
VLYVPYLVWYIHFFFFAGSTECYVISAAKRKRPLGRRRRRWEDNIRVDVREVGWEGVDWMRLAIDGDQWLALVDTVMNLLLS